MKTVALNGTLILFLANLLGKVIGAIYRIPLSNLLGAEGIGLYQMAFPMYSFLLVFITSGIGITLTRRIANFRSNNNVFEINQYYSMGKKLANNFGVILTIVIIVFALPLSYFQGNIKAVFGYLIISLGFIFACKLSVNRGYFQGFGNMLPTAISQIIEQLTKLLLGLICALILSKYGVVYGVVGALVGVVFGEIFATLYFKIKSKKKIANVNFSKVNYKNFVKECISVGINYSILPMSTLIDSFLVVNLLKLSGFNVSLSTGLYGVYSGMILPLINMPNVLISAIALTSIPDISYKLAKNNNVNEKINNIFKVSFMFVLPCVIGMYILSGPILQVVYPTLSQQYLNIASILLKYATFEMFFLCFLSISNSIMQAIDKTKQSINGLLIGLFVKIFIMLVIIPQNNISIYGASISNMIAYLIPCIINLNTIKKNTSARLSFKNIMLPILSSCIMISIIILCKKLFNNMSLGLLFITIMLSALFYFTFLIITKLWSIKDIKKLLQKD